MGHHHFPFFLPPAFLQERTRHGQPVFPLFSEKKVSPSIRPSNIASQSRSRTGRPNIRCNPTLSISIQDSLSPDFRNPLPTCCKYFASESVGRASCTNSTSGQSKPSEKISTLTSTLILPCLKPSTSSLRSEAGVLLSIATADTPCAL